jgi:hypothetical protein
LNTAIGFSRHFQSLEANNKKRNWENEEIFLSFSWEKLDTFGGLKFPNFWGDFGAFSANF